MDEVILGNFGAPSSHSVVNSFAADNAGYVAVSHSLHHKFYVNCHYIDIRARATPFGENANGYGMLTTVHYDKVRYIDIKANNAAYETAPSVTYTFGAVVPATMSIKDAAYTGFNSSTHKMQVYRVSEIITSGPNAITIKFGVSSDDDIQTKAELDSYVSDNNLDELETPKLMFIASKGFYMWDHAFQVLPRTALYLSVPDMNTANNQVTVGIQGFYSRY